MLVSQTKIVRRLVSAFVSPKRSWIDEIVLGFVILGLSLFLYQISPHITGVEYTRGTSQPAVDALPFFVDSRDPAEPLVIQFTVNLKTNLHSSIYTIRADDCLQELSINGEKLPSELIEPCMIDQPKNFMLKPYLKVGDNLIVANIADSGGRQGLSFESSRSDSLILSTKLSLLFFLFLLGLLIASRPRDPWKRATLLIIICGILIRLILFDATPFNVRANDPEGHVDYILYVVQHWTVPPIHSGWEFYQPPLYYFLMALPYRVAQVLGVPHLLIIRFLQFISFVLSLCLLGICTAISRLLFSDTQKKERLFLLAIIAFFPGIALFAPRINNDVLLQILSFLALGLTLSFWQRASTNTWYVLIIVLSFALLTKMNAVPLIAAAFATMVIHPAFSLKRKMLLAVTGLGILLAMTEWLFILRIVQDPSARMVGNIGNLHEGLMVTRTPFDFIIFNPIQVLWHPYNQAWDDAMRRSFFFEYFYRSAFFGEFFWGETLRRFAQVLLLGGYVCLIFIFVGFFQIRVSEWRRAFPLWIFFVSILGGHLFFRFYYPFAPSQDFRYSSILLLPAGYFLLIGIAQLRPRFQRYAYVFLAGWLLACLGFLVSLAVLNPT